MKWSFVFTTRQKVFFSLDAMGVIMAGSGVSNVLATLVPAIIEKKRIDQGIRYPILFQGHEPRTTRFYNLGSIVHPV